MLRLVTVADDKQVGSVTLTRGRAQLEGLARSVFGTMRRYAASDPELFEKLAGGWSNGAITFLPEHPTLIAAAAELLAEAEELIGNQVDAPVIAARLRALSGQRIVPNQIRDRLIQAVGDQAKLRAALAAVAADAQVTPIGAAGHIVLFDAAIHRSAEVVKAGDVVEIFRPGAWYTAGGRRVLLFKALVETPGRTPPGMWGTHTSGQAGVAALVAHLPGKHDQSSHARKGAVTGQAALDAVPAKLTPAPQGHFGNYEGATLDAPAGAGSARALAEYEGAEFFATNTALRAGQADATVTARVEDMDKTMGVSRLSDDIVVQRGVTDGNAVFGREAWHGDVVDWGDVEHGTDRWEAGERPDLTGLRFRDAAFTSTTADPAVADAFVGSAVRFQRETGYVGLEGEPVVMNVSVPRGTGAVSLGGMGTVGPRGPTDSAEILLERGLSFEVTADRGVGDDGIRRLDVAVVAGG